MVRLLLSVDVDDLEVEAQLDYCVAVMGSSAHFRYH